MLYPVDDIVRQVKILLDQNQEEHPIIVEEDNTLELKDIILQKILHAARHLLETSDVSLIDYGKSDTTISPVEISEIGWGELSAWKFAVPDDYLRLLTLRMSDWRRSVHTAIPFESAEYSQLQSSSIGITGNPERPFVAECQRIGTRNNAVAEWRELEVYTSATGEVVDFRYCPIPVYEENETDHSLYLNFPEKLYRLLLYQTGSLVAATYKDAALSQLLMNMIYEGEPETKEEQ